MSKAVVDRLSAGNRKYNMESRGSSAAVPGQEETFIILSEDRTASPAAGKNVSSERKTSQN